MSQEKLDYEFVPVDSVPEAPNRKRPGRYMPILEKFLASQHAVVRLEIKNLPKRMTNGEFEAIPASLATRARKHKLPILVSRRGREIYLQRRDDIPVMEADIAEQESGRRKVASDIPILERSIEELDISVRAYNCLRNANVNTISDLVAMQPAELKAAGLGKKIIEEIRDVLHGVGLELGAETVEPRMAS